MNESLLAERWVAAWNRRDVASLLALYVDDVEFVSPFVTLLASVRGAALRGKAALRAHFEASWVVGPGGLMALEEVALVSDGLTMWLRGGCAPKMRMDFELDADGRIARSTSRILAEVPTGRSA